MAQYVVVDTTTGKIVNVVEWDGQTPWQPNDATHQAHASADGQIGWDWVDGKAVNPNPPTGPLLVKPANPST